MRTTICLICVVFLLGACGPGGTDSTAAPAKLAQETLAQGTSYQPGCADRPDDDRLIRTDAAWADYWNQVHPEAPQPARPAVDFATATVLATCGPRSDPGHGSAIADVGASGNRLHVLVTDTSPGANCAYPAVVVYGHHAVRVDGVFDVAEFTHTPEQGPPC